jgi:hypothetical protein
VPRAFGVGGIMVSTDLEISLVMNLLKPGRIQFCLYFNNKSKVSFNFQQSFCQQFSIN